MAEDNALTDYVKAREYANSPEGISRAKWNAKKAATEEDARASVARDLKGEHPAGPPIAEYNYPQAAFDGNLPAPGSPPEQFDPRYAVAPDLRTLDQKSNEYDLPNQINALGATPQALQNVDPELLGQLTQSRMFYNATAKAVQESVDFMDSIFSKLPDRPKESGIHIPTIGNEMAGINVGEITPAENLATFAGSLAIGTLGVNKFMGAAGAVGKIPSLISDAMVGMAFQDPTKGEQTLPPWLLKAAGVTNEDVLAALNTDNHDELTGRVINGMEMAGVFGLAIPKTAKLTWLIGSGIAKGLVRLARGELKGATPGLGGSTQGGNIGTINRRGVINPFPTGARMTGAPEPAAAQLERNAAGQNFINPLDSSPRSLVQQMYVQRTARQFPNQRAFAEALDAQAGGVLEETPENMQQFADIIANEALYAIEADPAAAVWYRDRVAGMKRIATLIHEDLLTNKEHEMAFEMAMALSSNGTTVASNVEQGLRIFDEYASSGKFPEAVPYAGKEHEAIAYGLRVYNKLIEQMGPDKLRAFLDAKMTVREVNAISAEYGLKPVGGELMDTLVHGSAIFGPKIGGGFFQNLHGNYEPLTMDRWFMRTWNRIKGDLATSVTPELHAQRLDRFRAALTVEDAKSVGVRINNPATAKPATLEKTARLIHKRYADGGYKEKTEINKAAKQLTADFEKTNDAPMNGTQRRYMRDTFALALARVNEATGLKLQNADLQALIWYPEKDFYALNGVSNAKAAPTDYQTEFEKLAIARGIAAPAVRAASDPAGTLAAELAKGAKK